MENWPPVRHFSNNTETSSNTSLASQFSCLNMSKRKRLFEEKAAPKKAAPAQLVKYSVPRPMKRGPRPEIKFHDVAILPAAPLTLQAGQNYTDNSLVLLNVIPQGTDRINRIGRDVYMSKLHVRAEVDYFTVGADPFRVNRFRCIAFMDIEAGSVGTNTVEQVYKTRAAGQIDMNITRNLTDSTRYRVLFNGLSPTMAGSSGGLSLPDKYTWEYDVPLNQKIRFAGSATTNPQNYLIYLCFVSDDNQLAGSFEPRFTLQSRVMFYDT